jgi:hypothetical protein
MSLESIIIFALIAVVSSVLKAVAKNGVPQKKSEEGTISVEPRVQSTVKARNKTKSFNINETVKMPGTPVQKTKIKTSNMEMEPELFNEEILIEGSKATLTPIQSEVIGDAAIYTIQSDITFDELQRSVIMAEVLGKPRALKKTIR